MASINPYLNFKGKTEEDFNFYRSVLGGEFQTLQLMSDTPLAEKLPANERNLIMHVALPIGDNSVLMGSDIVESMGHKLSPGNNYSIAVQPDNEQETERLFNGLSAGGKVTMPLERTFWGAYFGMCKDYSVFSGSLTTTLKSKISNFKSIPS
jgi:PhnB protein